MSLSTLDYEMIVKASNNETKLLIEMVERQNKQIKLLERIVAILENRLDDGR